MYLICFNYWKKNNILISLIWCTINRESFVHFFIVSPEYDAVARSVQFNFSRWLKRCVSNKWERDFNCLNFSNFSGLFSFLLILRHDLSMIYFLGRVRLGKNGKITHKNNLSPQTHTQYTNTYGWQIELWQIMWVPFDRLRYERITKIWRIRIPFDRWLYVCCVWWWKLVRQSFICFVSENWNLKIISLVSICVRASVERFKMFS